MRNAFRTSGVNGGWVSDSSKLQEKLAWARKEVEQKLEAFNTGVAGTVDQDGTVCMKAMFVAQRQNIHYFWFSTNTSSRRYDQIQKNPNMSMYFYDDSQGIALMGKAYEEKEKKYREWLWDESAAEFYPQGVDDPDFCVLCFETQSIDYYVNGETFTFAVETEEKKV